MGPVTGSAGGDARFKNPFLKSTRSTSNTTSTKITKPYNAATMYLIPPDTIPPHPSQSYDSLLPKQQQYAAFQQSAEPPEEQACSPTPAITMSRTEMNAGF